MSNISIIFTSLFIFNIIPLVISNQEQIYECGGKAQNLKIGDEVFLCIHIISLQKKIGMKIKVDEYSMISFNKIHGLIFGHENEAIELMAQMGEAKTMTTVII